MVLVPQISRKMNKEKSKKQNKSTTIMCARHKKKKQIHKNRPISPNLEKKSKYGKLKAKYKIFYYQYSEFIFLKLKNFEYFFCDNYEISDLYEYKLYE